MNYKKISRLIVIPAFLAVMTGCSSLVEKAVESGLERATGNKTDIDLSEGGVSFTGEDGENYDVSTENGSFSVRSESGNLSGGQSLPAHFPDDLPQYPGATVLSGVEQLNADGALGYLQAVWTTEDSVETIEAYYKKSLVDNGWKVESGFSYPGAGTMMNAGKLQDGVPFLLTISFGGEKIDGKNMIQFSLGTVDQ